jgi:hypothetical protein
LYGDPNPSGINCGPNSIGSWLLADSYQLSFYVRTNTEKLDRKRILELNKTHTLHLHKCVHLDITYTYTLERFDLPLHTP